MINRCKLHMFRSSKKVVCDPVQFVRITRRINVDFVLQP